MELIYERITKTYKSVRFRYSECDKLLIEQHTWSIDSNGYINARIKIGKKTKLKRLHRLLMDEPENGIVDHIDGDRMNNTRSNLRLVNHTQNAMNQGLRRDNKSGYKGVSFNKLHKKWEVRIKYEGKYKFLGLFIDLDEAVIVRKAADIKYYGEYRRI